MAMMQLGRNLGKNFKGARPLSIGLGASSAKGGIAMTPPPARLFCSGTPPPSEKGLFSRLAHFLDKALSLPLCAIYGSILGYYYNKDSSISDGGRGCSSYAGGSGRDGV